MTYTSLPTVAVGEFGKASWANLVDSNLDDHEARIVAAEAFIPSGDLAFSQIQQIAGLSVAGVTGNATADLAAITAGSDKQVLRRSGTTLTFGAVDLSSSAAATGILPLANLPPFSFTQFWPAAVTDQGGTYAPIWNSNGDATKPSYAAIFGTNVTGAELEFVDATMNQAWVTFRLPTDWTGALDLAIFWRSVVTSGNVVWQVQTGGVVDGGVYDVALNTAQTVTDAAQGTASRFNTATITGLTLTGLVAGGWMHLRLIRDPSHGSDTLGASAFFLGAELRYRRQVTA